MSAGIFLLALSYHLGAQSAGAQAPGNPVVAVNDCYIFTANGDIYYRSTCGASVPTTCTLVGNVFGGGPVPAQRETFGALKSRYRGAREAAQSAPQGR